MRDVRHKMNKRLSLVIAIVAAALVAGIRSYYESSMPELVPTDAQGGIWIVYSAVMGVGTFFCVSYSFMVHWLFFQKRTM
jgi:hypothetical protein